MARQLVSEGLGTACLLCAVVGSGIMGEQLAGGNLALVLLVNSLATGAVLACLILIFAPLSGAHFNPVVTLAAVLAGKLSRWEALFYFFVQVIGALLGVWTAHLMFGLPVWMVSHHPRSGSAQWLSESIATFGLVAVIHGCKRYSIPVLALAVGGYIAAAYWFTSSTSFANPAVTLARALTDTFVGIRPADVFPFVITQLLGGLAATLLFRWLAKTDAS